MTLSIPNDIIAIYQDAFFQYGGNIFAARLKFWLFVVAMSQ